MSESARGEGGRVWVPRKPQDPRDPQGRFPKSERYYFLEERYPKYGNLVPRDIATREIFNVCVNEGLSVEKDRQCVYLDLTHIPRQELDRKLGGILEIYEKFQGVDPRDDADEDFPGRPLLDGRPVGRLRARRPTAAWQMGSPQEPSRRTFRACTPSASATISTTARTAWGPTRCCRCIFSGLIVAPGIETLAQGAERQCRERAMPASLFDQASEAVTNQRPRRAAQAPGGGENPYLIHQELGDVMTKAATVVRRNEPLMEALAKVRELGERAQRCSLSDTGNWTNQNVVFTKALRDMFPLAKAILKGALQRDECRGAHFKPDFDAG